MPIFFESFLRANKRGEAIFELNNKKNGKSLDAFASRQSER